MRPWMLALLMAWSAWSKQPDLRWYDDELYRMCKNAVDTGDLGRSISLQRALRRNGLIVSVFVYCFWYKM